ncbi:leucine-rich repeat and calponin homology domain-containing protein 4-like [Anopheles bellator]|uniref:leucine-rich repeat and calponin homology domain-containing protein 4-like n=1 Tax=Anopheles bellator TaxID=139047 RepID=UPI0026498B30|nr:leucine-rich repeat and calponin homology domain-containing protein 4-like [Anopheles bellator]
MGYFTNVLNVIFLTTALGCCSANHARRCISGSEAFVCALYHFKYEPGQDIPLFDLQPGTKAVEFVKPFYKPEEPSITVYDAVLHRQLGMPVAVGITKSMLTLLEMPPNLQYGDFANNRLSRIVVDSSQSYAMRYLNLNGNNELNPANISLFAELETLHMSNSDWRTLPAGLFSTMTRLQHLTISGNRLKEIDLKTLPGSLTLLRMDRNLLPKLNFEDVRFPQLEDLNVQRNELTAMNISALVERSPKLKLFSIGRNPISLEKLDHIVSVLNRHNISYYSMENPEDWTCSESEVRIRGICIPKDSVKPGWGEWLTQIFFFCLVPLVLFGAAPSGWLLWRKFKGK